MGQAADIARAVTSLRALLRPPPGMSLNGAIGPHRRWAWARGRLADVKAIRTEYGGTVNDVVLAVIARGFRDLLLGRGEPVESRAVRTMVPVSVRTSAERGTYNNKVSAMFAELPVQIADPAERLAAVRTQMQGLKESHQAVAGSTLTSLGGFAPAMLLAMAGRVATRTPQHSVNTVTTNVPGPQHPIYLAGHRMLEYFPFVPLAGHVRIGVAIVSYDGALNFGVTGDYETAPDIQVLCDGIEAGIGELLPKAATPARTSGISICELRTEATRWTVDGSLRRQTVEHPRPRRRPAARQGVDDRRPGRIRGRGRRRARLRRDALPRKGRAPSALRFSSYTLGSEDEKIMRANFFRT